MLKDKFGRQISYLRISVTDRCNLRCVYCMPPEGITWKDHNSMLRYEEIALIVRVAAAAGVRKIRLTGGEPLVRPGIPSLIRMISQIPGIEDLSLTTNGILLGKMASELSEAGLTRVNVSLDTLNPEKFSKITRGGSIDKVLQGLKTAEAYHLSPVKINVVTMRGVNEDELLDLAQLALIHPWHIRFIELMPVKNMLPWGAEFPSPDAAFISNQEVLELLAPLRLEKISASSNDGPAREYKIPGAPGTIGFISPLSDHFCNNCNRLRLTADGNLRPCLLSDFEIPLLPALRAGEPILPILQRAIGYKPSGHELEKAHYPVDRCMTQIGG